MRNTIQAWNLSRKRCRITRIEKNRREAIYLHKHARYARGHIWGGRAHA